MAKDLSHYEVKPAKELKNNDLFLITKKHKVRVAYHVHHFKKETTAPESWERVKGKILISVENCGQIVMDANKKIFISKL